MLVPPNCHRKRQLKCKSPQSVFPTKRIGVTGPGTSTSQTMSIPLPVAIFTPPSPRGSRNGSFCGSTHESFANIKDGEFACSHRANIASVSARRTVFFATKFRCPDSFALHTQCIVYLLMYGSTFYVFARIYCTAK